MEISASWGNNYNFSPNVYIKYLFFYTFQALSINSCKYEQDIETSVFFSLDRNRYSF